MEEDTVRDFLKSLGSKSPTPGGGAVSALNGAIAAAQLKMICEYTKNEEIKNKAGFLAQKVNIFLGLVKSDSDAFLQVSKAYAAKDSKQIDSALTKAIQVSVDIAVNCEELVSFFEGNYKEFNKRLSADAVVVVANLQAAVESARAMEKTNLDALQGDKPRNILAEIEHCDELMKRISNIRQKLEVSE